MAKRRANSDERLDELYREHPEGFVAGRNRLAKELRDAGDGEQAARVKRLRRPTAAAWVINRVALTSPAEVEELAEAGRQVEEAQGRALEGHERGSAEWRAAAARESEATSAVLEVAERGARDAGHPPSARTLELVVETLRAATGDPELRERMVRGRVERERSAATLGTPSAAPRRHTRAVAKRKVADRARRELETLEGKLADATAREERMRARVEQATEALRQAKARLADAKREATVLRGRVSAARRRERKRD